MNDWEEDCMLWQGKVLNGANAHWCGDFDDLPIDDTCWEATVCRCIERTKENIDELEAKFKEEYDETDDIKAPF